MTSLTAKKILYNNVLFSIGLLTLSLSIFKINGYSFSVANILVIYLFFHFAIHFNKIVVIIYLIIILYFSIIALLFIQKLDFTEYIKSFLLTGIMLYVYLSSLNKEIHSKNFNLVKIISIVSILIVLFEIIQVLEFSILGSSFTWFLLDSFSISTATDIGRFQAVNFLAFIRPISFFHEPSYLGVVLLILLISANELKVNKLVIYILYLGIICSFSTTALIFLLLYIISRNINRLKNILLLILFSTLSFLFFLDEEILDSVFRLSEIFNAGTSGNERLIGPYEYLAEQFFNRHYYFGIPLGQSDLIFNNSFYLLFLYFGIFTPVLFSIFIVYIFYIYNENAIKYLIAFCSLLFLSGAIFTLEDALLLYILNYSFNETSSRISNSRLILRPIKLNF